MSGPGPSAGTINDQKDIPSHTHHGIPCDTTSTAKGDLVWLLDEVDVESPLTHQDVNEEGKTGWLTRDIVNTINSRIDQVSSALRELSLQIHDNPELGWKEYKAHDAMTEFMTRYGFEVQKHYLGLETAWRADFKHRSSSNKSNSEPRTLGLNSEMDALPGVGHACGHNLIGIAGIAVALATKTVLEKHDLDGNIVLLGTPAEEGGAGKVRLIEKGGYKDMDICLMCHPGPGPKLSSGTGPSLALNRIEVEYFGHTAHASAAPWEGQNALDAAFLAYSAISALRQQVKPTHRTHGIVEGKDWAANIIPDYAKMKWYVRAPSAAELDVFRERVLNCFKAAALATGCRVKINVDETMCDLRQNAVLAREYVNVIKDSYGMTTNSVQGAIGGSTEVTTSYSPELPSLHPSFAIPTRLNGGNHTPGFTEAARTKQAHTCTLRVSKALTQVGVRAILDEAFLKEVSARK
ncbi:hypothetical protein CPB86DRAFT_760956 [Serendipita vermifera]|nr:hypothetical protein CPB86DRAFT_760956 [Serendipita vermifera]